MIQKDIDTAIQYCTTTTDSIPQDYLKQQLQTITTHDTSHWKTLAQNMFKTSGIYQENEKQEEEEVFLHFPQATNKK